MLGVLSQQIGRIDLPEREYSKDKSFELQQRKLHSERDSVEWHLVLNQSIPALEMQIIEVD